MRFKTDWASLFIGGKFTVFVACVAGVERGRIGRKEKKRGIGETCKNTGSHGRHSLPFSPLSRFSATIYNNDENRGIS